MPTYRPRGRLDYQIIYISSGLGHFHFGTAENETIVSAGNFCPISSKKSFKNMSITEKDKTEVLLGSLYWK